MTDPAQVFDGVAMAVMRSGVMGAARFTAEGPFVYVKGWGRLTPDEADGLANDIARAAAYARGPDGDV